MKHADTLHIITYNALQILFLQHIQSRLAPGASFNLLGYSFGGILALELAVALEAEGREGCLYLVDSSPEFLQAVQERSIGNDDDRFEINLICIIFNLMAPHEATPAVISQVRHHQLLI
jgi:thioesterase domain-containing protein